MALPFPTFVPGFRLIDGSALNQLVQAVQNESVWPGTFYYVDPKNGNDSNTGLLPSGAWQSLTHATSVVKGGQNNVVVLMSDGTTASTARLSATLAWSLNATHLIGISAPTTNSQRARISHPTTATLNISPLLNITASDCIFMNFSIFQGIGQSSTAEQEVDINGGQRNYFYNVDFQGMGSANGAGQSTSYVLAFKGDAAENTFERCNFGVETEPRTAANSTIVVAAGATAERNEFYDCFFSMYPTTVQTQTHLLISGSLNGSHMTFKNCLFGAFGSSNVSGALQPNVAMTVGAVNGEVWCYGCATRCAALAASGPVYGDRPAASATGGLLISQT